MSRNQLYILLLWTLFMMALAGKSFDSNADLCFLSFGYNFDALEYHLLAANFALHDQFPVYGLISKVEDYHLCMDNTHLSAYYKILESAGPVVFAGRPPVYPLVLGFCYKVFGLYPEIQYYLNVVSLLLATYFLGIGMWRLGLHSLLAFPLALVYYLMTKDQMVLNDAEVFSKLPFLLAILSLLFAMRWDRSGAYALGGMALGLALLTKGTLLPFFVLFSLYIIYLAVSTGQVTLIRHQAFLIGGMSLMIIPWMLFINPKIKDSKKARFDWAAMMDEAIPDINIRERHELIDPITNDYSREAAYCFLKYHQLGYVRDNGRIIISNQYNAKYQYSLHNEFCMDGEPHPEQNFISGSFYKTKVDTSASPMTNIARFYFQNPLLGLKVIYKKLENLRNENFNFYFAAIFLLFLAPACKRLRFNQRATLLMLLAFVVIYLASYQLEFFRYIFFAIIISSLLMGFSSVFLAPRNHFENVLFLLALSFILLAELFYGDPRFIAVLDSIWLCTIVLSLDSLYKHYKSETTTGALLN